MKEIIQKFARVAYANSVSSGSSNSVRNSKVKGNTKVSGQSRYTKKAKTVKPPTMRMRNRAK